MRETNRSNTRQVSIDIRVKKAILRDKIIQLGKAYSEDKTFLENYAENVILENEKNLDIAINCFTDLLQRAEILGVHTRPEMQKPRKNDIRGFSGVDNGGATYNGEVGWVLQRPFVHR